MDIDNKLKKLLIKLRYLTDIVAYQQKYHSFITNIKELDNDDVFQSGGAETSQNEKYDYWNDELEYVENEIKKYINKNNISQKKFNEIKLEFFDDMELQINQDENGDYNDFE